MNQTNLQQLRRTGQAPGAFETSNLVAGFISARMSGLSKGRFWCSMAAIGNCACQAYRLSTAVCTELTEVTRWKRYNPLPGASVGC